MTLSIYEELQAEFTHLDCVHRFSYSTCQMKKTIVGFLSAAPFLLWFYSDGFATVKPSQIVVLANEQSLESLALADYYMARRDIPKHHRIDLDLSLSESISRKQYDESLVKPLRAELRKRGLAEQIRVLVTVWGIPLRVGSAQSSPEEVEWIDDAQQWMRSAISMLQESRNRLVKRLPKPSQVETEDFGPSNIGRRSFSFRSQKIKKWKKELQALFTSLRKPGQESVQPSDQGKLIDALEKDARRIFGTFGIPSTPPGSNRTNSPEHIRVIQVLRSLMYRPSPERRAQAYALVQEHFGLFGILSFANWEIRQYRYEDSLASVDSELSLLWWDSGSYPLSGRIPNPYYLRHSVEPIDWPLPTILVSRIDAPTVRHAQELIDRTIETERKGLRGKAYIDSRGRKGGRPFSYGYYDANLQSFAKELQKSSLYPVEWENTKQRFSRPGQAPNVALYVGWYRLQHYEDAFTFNPGAIGYHIASAEAVSVHKPDEKGWCKNALERGITVTLGPVGEPYLDAFPLPRDFFGLLFSGRYSLVEAYFLSKRYMSWKMVLFGDPLYQPWGSSDSEMQELATQLLDRRSWPIPPAQGPLPSFSQSRDINAMPGRYQPIEAAVFR